MDFLDLKDQLSPSHLMTIRLSKILKTLSPYKEIKNKFQNKSHQFHNYHDSFTYQTTILFHLA